ncbi:hypothetical protein PR048_016516 [Dryococelus australis]|uniref:Uncharacterized protein n=1 Tax=Dryococelus australis TaxID=614101 RepID=A0ABQ9HK00_9NEOP|nr:hypothetical protein PR048_016516 [Dryococelus australis]
MSARADFPSKMGEVKWPQRLLKTLQDGVNARASVGTLVSHCLLAYRYAPQCTNKVSPAHLMFGKAARTRLELIKPQDVRGPEQPIVAEGKRRVQFTVGIKSGKEEEYSRSLAAESYLLNYTIPGSCSRGIASKPLRYGRALIGMVKPLVKTGKGLWSSSQPDYPPVGP